MQHTALNGINDIDIYSIISSDTREYSIFNKQYPARYISPARWILLSQNRHRTRRDTLMFFVLGKTSEISFTCYDAILECTRHFVPMFSYEKLPCALQDGVKWWRIFTSALVKFRTKYRLSDTSGPVSILCFYTIIPK